MVGQIEPSANLSRARWLERINSSTDRNIFEHSPVTLLNSSVTVSVSVFESQIIIPLYVIIFVLSILGNSLVIVTLTKNKRMRTVTNVYLLNLAVSDLLLGVFCMPFTLVGQVLRNFIFGAALCKMIPYIQAVSVSVGVWTLVAISLERYFAICRPLKSRRWQTQFHAYKMIAVVWAASLIWNGPILAVSSLQEMRRRKSHKCREEWPSAAAEQAYNLFLDGMLLLVPLIIMSLAYSLIVSKLWKGLRREIQHNSCQRHLERSFSTGAVKGSLSGVAINNNGDVTDGCLLTPRTQRHVNNLGDGANGKVENGNGIWLFKGVVQVSLSGNNGSSKNGSARAALVTPQRSAACGCYKNRSTRDAGAVYAFSRHAVRSNHMDKSIEAKKKVIRMLFVIIAEFFICWAPLHVLNTVYLFWPDLLYNYVGSTGVSLVQLLAYVSSCCNPITYCFMNKKFRQAFLGVFGCYRCTGCCCDTLQSASGHGGIVVRGRGRRRNDGLGARPPVSDASLNDSTACLARASTLGRSEVIMLEGEDRV